MRARFPWLLALGYTVLFSALGALKYAVHRNLVDFGIFAQTAASAFGCFCNPIEGSHWAFHFSPVLYVPGALLVLWRSPLVLIVLQSAACALVIPPIYGLIERRAPSLAALGATAVALYPPLAGLAFGDFHENAFAPAAIAWSAWAFDGDYFMAALIFAVVAICVKEDQAIFVGVAAAAIAWQRRGTASAGYALAAALLGFGAAAAFFAAIQPHHAAAPQWAPERFYDWSAGDVRRLFPAGVFARVGFLMLILAPLAFVPLRSRAFVAAIPPLAEVLFSKMPTTFTLGTHYAGAWLGYVLAAFAYGLRGAPELSARRLAWIALALCVVEFAVADPLHPGLNLRPVQARDRALDRAIADLPSDASVATQEEAYTHLALRDPNARLLPESASLPVDACFILIDRAYPQSPRLEEYGAALGRLVRSGTYVLVRRTGDIELYRRANACR